MTGRTILWRAGMNVFESNLLIGVGAGALPVAMMPYLGFIRVAHSTFISILAETGLIGFALFGVVILSIEVCVVSMRFEERVLWTVVLVTLCVALLAITWEQRRQMWFFLALAIAQTGRRSPIAKQEEYGHQSAEALAGSREVGHERMGWG